MLGYDSLMNHYKTNFSLMQHHKYRLAEIESMIPWEKLIYVDMLRNYIKEQEELERDRAMQRKSQQKTRR